LFRCSQATPVGLSGTCYSDNLRRAIVADLPIWMATRRRWLMKRKDGVL
jgi:hypothetical protein